jgi:two-component system, chemotaxis family, chemotaxis protein CheY
VECQHAQPCGACDDLADAPPTLLLIEDDKEIRQMLRDLLHDDGYNVIEAGDGAEGIALIRDYFPPPVNLCLILLDMMLPISDGGQVLEALAQLGNYVPVVAMSADRVQLRRARRAGAEATLEKPFDLDRLLDVVGRNCKRSTA